MSPSLVSECGQSVSSGAVWTGVRWLGVSAPDRVPASDCVSGWSRIIRSVVEPLDLGAVGGGTVRVLTTLVVLTNTGRLSQ